MLEYQVENFQKYRKRKGGNGIRRDQMKAEKTRKGARELRKKNIRDRLQNVENE